MQRVILFIKIEVGGRWSAKQHFFKQLIFLRQQVDSRLQMFYFTLLVLVHLIEYAIAAALLFFAVRIETQHSRICLNH